VKHISERKSGSKRLLSVTFSTVMLAGAVIFSGCHRQVAAGQAVSDSSQDPADANMAPVDQDQQQTAAPASSAPVPAQGRNVQNESQQRADEYRRTGAQAGAPVDQQGDQQDQAAGPDQNDQNAAPDQDDQNYDDQVNAGQEAVEEADQPPPALPVYVQPVAPEPNYIWTPGYWSYAPLGYYWVPGAWVAAPYDGALWTPGYWGFYGSRYRFYRGYWGLHIGFYGGVPYGFGYTGYGYYGGYWRGSNFYYNRTVNRINTSRITNIYNRPVIVHNNTRISYNGGRGGLQVRPRPAEIAAMRGPRIAPMSAQLQNQRQAAQSRQQFFNTNKGRPAMATVARPLVADKGIQRPVARPMPATRPQVRPGQPNQGRPEQPNQVRPGQPNQARPGQPNQVRPGQPNPVRPGTAVQPNRPEMRPNVPQTRPETPQLRPNQPQVRPVNPQERPNQQVRPMPSQPQTRPVQPQYRPAQPETRPVQPQVRPVQPQVRPMQPQQVRPVQPQVRPLQQPQARPMQQPQNRPQPMQPRPQPQARPMQAPAPQTREAPRNEGEHR
jgi:hypothetical protein